MANNIDSNETKLTAKDFVTDQDVRWCPGCGDYSVLAQTQRTLPDLGLPKEKIVWISGIGCSSRFPYYMNTYGFHTIHGRAAAIATGAKLANPELSVWVATGDGDLLSIGGNHFIHTCRKNIDLKILLFNNRIYGLTKGQYSPTSEKGKVTKSSPYGSLDFPFNPVTLALGAEASFVARSLDRDPKHLQYVLKRAAEHKGTAFVEIYQNCVIFNDGAFDAQANKETKDDNVLFLEHGKPMVFGKNKDKGIIVDGTTPKVVSLTDGKYSVNDLLVHNEFDQSVVLAYLLGQMSNHAEFPTPVGIFRQIKKSTYHEDMMKQIDAVKAKKGEGDLEKLLFSGNTWEVK
ncbi:MAG: 2-oxoacid:ferredoxin oxidoreductase subunit beta [Bacteroidota bacterium]|jgi:2-oxoglutarate ferredoxin oxidoreductase subunit beta|nr:2-oxoacid:ferredoxin oxidoreductase subunit beta [Ignavibacteria bacterium]MCU7498311.1 2-oxoacid:ferredoxin oxidoreductase subunit beta [Ignavibacteria bacterium]MCU7512664.1 2-oxoacid:ferredoxin oxidoreductase subunit beta [Ignavibacteria bacterium]MCU7520205.1 2-oxoacid:ferredoxin oxidoreductase subunit beta [Ignavibacteria bacterium]MCU7523674.1 2-oxoacid:ferredoxin oxidoreductase subunit beta [Ignavibacteria bacterium]